MRSLPRDAFAKSPEDAELPKVILFTEVSTITYDEYLELRRRYAKDGRVLVWCGRPGVYAPDGAVTLKRDEIFILEVKDK